MLKYSENNVTGIPFLVTLNPAPSSTTCSTPATEVTTYLLSGTCVGQQHEALSLVVLNLFQET